MTRCSICHRILWFWQSQGWAMLSPKPVRWHGRCLREVTDV
jgi:hypothetical protein